LETAADGLADVMSVFNQENAHGLMLSRSEGVIKPPERLHTRHFHAAAP
jgi:hypothetical protein